MKMSQKLSEKCQHNLQVQSLEKLVKVLFVAMYKKSSEDKEMNIKPEHVNKVVRKVSAQLSIPNKEEGQSLINMLQFFNSGNIVNDNDDENTVDIDN